MNNDIETKEAYSAKIEAKVEQLNGRIDEILAKANRAKADMTSQYQEQIDDLCVKRDVAKVKLRDLKEASGEAWSDLREGLERSWDELSHAFDLAIKHFQ
jgi:predicted  nucleic acid-binding Zn-ribbon protein